MVTRRHKYADGGKVKKDHLAAPKKPPAPPPKPADLGTGMANKAGNAINARKKMLDEL